MAYYAKTYSLEPFINNQTDQIYEPIQRILAKDSEELAKELELGTTVAGTGLSPAQYDGSAFLTEYISETLLQHDSTTELAALSYSWNILNTIT